MLKMYFKLPLMCWCYNLWWMLYWVYYFDIQYWIIIYFQAIGGMDFSALIVKMDVNNVQVAQYVRYVIKGNHINYNQF